MDPQLESRPTFLFFKGAANGLFAEGADRLSRGVNDQQALLIGIKCERGSHRFFKKYGERFEDRRANGSSSGCRRGAPPRPPDSRIPRAPGAPPAARKGGKCASAKAQLIDLHTHTTASSGLYAPKELVHARHRRI
jgi:hypothetical protein